MRIFIIFLVTKYFMVIKSRRIRGARHVARTEKIQNAYKILVRYLKVRDYSEDLGIDGKII